MCLDCDLVKIVSTDDGRMEVFAYNWQMGDATPDYLVHSLTGQGNVDKLTEEQFEQWR